MKILLLALMGASVLYGQRVVASGQISTVSGNGSTMVTTAGPQTSGACVTIDANGNHVPSAQPCGSVASTTLVMALPLTNATFPAVRGYNIAAGDTDLITAQPGKRVFPSYIGGLNPTLGTINYYFELKTTSTVISSGTNANPVVFTAASAPATGTAVVLSGLTSGWTTLNAATFTATRLSATTFSVPLDSTTFGAFSATSPVWSGYYRLTNSVAALTHANTPGPSILIALEPGESFSIHTDVAGLNLSGSVIQFDSSSAFKTVKLLGLTTGDNLLYTAPVGKTSFIWGSGGPGTLNSTSQIFFVSDAGGARATNFCSVPSGGATTCLAFSANSLGTASTAASSKLANEFTTGISLSSQDFLVLNVDTGAASQIAWINVSEI
jgi:hypothetical protein